MLYSVSMAKTKSDNDSDAARSFVGPQRELRRTSHCLVVLDHYTDSRLSIGERIRRPNFASRSYRLERQVATFRVSSERKILWVGKTSAAPAASRPAGTMTFRPAKALNTVWNADQSVADGIVARRSSRRKTFSTC